MKTPDIFDLYTDYLITSFSHTTATGLSGLVDNAISHDPVTRFLSQQDFTPLTKEEKEERQTTDNTIDKRRNRQKDNGPYRTTQKAKVEQHEYHYEKGVNSCVPGC